MTVKEARKLIAVFMVTYPNYKPIDTELAAMTWADVMSEYSYEQVNMALRMYMKASTSGFAPTPGQLVEYIQKTAQLQELNEMEAWALVSKAIRNSGYNSVEEFAKLPPIVQKAVGLPSQLRIWALDENYNEEVVSSNFIKCYRNELARANELQKLPSEVKQLIKNVAQGSYSAQIAEKREDVMKSLLENKNALEAKIEDIETYSKTPKEFENLKNKLRR